MLSYFGPQTGADECTAGAGSRAQTKSETS